jgi:[FeFe] hydrogenase H-cluster maturation GTPase HydF
MSLNDKQSSMRTHISFFGMRNAGKSSVVNAVTGQELSIVSDTLGTTTDPVQKAMEILPLGPVVIIDTPGFDDEGELGELRIQKAKRVLNKTDIAVLVVDITKGISKTDETLISIFKDKNIPYIIAYNKTDIADEFNESSAVNGTLSENEIYVSAKTNGGINDLREKIAAISSRFSNDKLIIGDRLKKGDIVILVIPIDESAPKGRIILPQQNVLRECLDAGASALCVQPGQLDGILNSLNKKPRIVITDSQAFGEVSNIVPDDICLTSFSILLAQYKGYLEPALKGIEAIKKLNRNSIVLIGEGCTHHRQCNDIGTVKIPKLLNKLSGIQLKLETCSGVEFPEDLSKYDLIVHCGGCMLNEREMQYRIKCASDQNVPVINYGMLFAYANRILDRALKIFDF